MESGVRLKFRTYTTSDPLDAGRYDRKDRIYSWSARVSRVFGVLTPFLQVESAGRRIDLPGALDAADSEGEYDATVMLAGLEWMFERKN
jgi:hypothetical protein